MRTIILVSALVSTSVSFAQNVNTLKADLAACKTNTAKIQEENDYLRKSLNILKPIKNIQREDIEVNLIGCEGNARDQTVTVSLTLTNRIANREFQFRSAESVDVQGKGLQTYEINIGKGGVRNKLFTDTPIIATFKFTQVLPSIKILKLFSASYHGLGQDKDGSFEFKDIDITWK